MRSTSAAPKATSRYTWRLLAAVPPGPAAWALIRSVTCSSQRSKRLTWMSRSWSALTPSPPACSSRSQKRAGPRSTTIDAARRPRRWDLSSPTASVQHRRPSPTSVASPPPSPPRASICCRPSYPDPEPPAGGSRSTSTTAPRCWERDPAPVLLALARQADVVFVGLDEAGALWKVQSVDELASLLPPSCVLVVKNGAEDAITVRGGHRVTVPARRAAVVDSVGAGDAFAAGWLAGALRGLSDEARLKLGHFVASTSLGTVADVAPLPPVEHICEAIGVSIAQWSAAATRVEGAAPCP